MKPSVAEKADKPAAKSAPKVFDVAHPGKSKPSATSRPIIVSNRPILQDPMVSSTIPSDVASAEDKPSPATVKVTIKPLETAEEPKAEKTDRSDKTIAELAAEAENGATKSTDTAPKKEDDKPAEADPKASETAESTPEADAKSSEASKPDDEASTTETKSDDTQPTEDSKDAKQTAELEAAAKKREEINGLVESRDYFLPINAVERHRSKVVAIFGLVLILALGALLVDLLLDVGFIRLGGVHSLTHFFSS